MNWLAVVVGWVLAFLLGWLWYSPTLFGEKWAEGVGVELGSADKMPAAALVSQALGLFLLSWAVGVTAANAALLTFILIVLALAVLLASGGLFSKKSTYAIATESGYVLVAALVMFVAQGVL
jgi:VIT1/CCC1 family predicted Fe2+/Mn2+ transporter